MMGNMGGMMKKVQEMQAKMQEMQKELENKLDDFYKAMSWEKPNPNLAKASQFFGF